MTVTCIARELQQVQGTSDKFYRSYLVLDDASAGMIIFQWGRRGTRGQFKTQPIRSRQDGERAVDTLLRSKVSKGYREIHPVPEFSVSPDLYSTERPSPAFLGKLDSEWQERIAERHALALEQISSVSGGVRTDDPDTLVVLHRFELEARSEIVALAVKDLLPLVPSAVGKHGAALAVSAQLAQSIMTSYSWKAESTSLSAEVTDQLVEVMMGLWDPTASGPLASVSEALSTAYLVL